MAYAFLTIDFTGAIGTRALAISENNLIVGFYVDAGSVMHGFLDQSNIFTTIDDPLGTNIANIGNTVSTGVNDPGQIVGYYFDATGLAHGFFDKKGTFTTIDAPAGSKGTFLEGIAENGRMVGYYLDSNNLAHGFLDDKGSFTIINFSSTSISAGTVQTFAFGINDPGKVVGYYLDTNNKAHGFLFDKGTFTTIDDPLSNGNTFAQGIAENGRIVGYYLDGGNHAHGFVDDRGTFVTIDKPGATDTFAQGIDDEGRITGYYIDAAGVRHGFEATPPIAVVDTDTGEDLGGIEKTYSGPVGGLEHQFIYPDNDSINVTVADDNWFLKGGPGKDALKAHGGYNVLDGGTGSNFLTGGTGTDTFFVDDRSPPADVWSTVNGFRPGDDATIFGSFSINDVTWVDNEGATGFTGLTMHVFKSGQPTASLTLPGFSTADLHNGKINVQFGSEQDGTPFMHIIAS